MKTVQDTAFRNTSVRLAASLLLLALMLPAAADQPTSSQEPARVEEPAGAFSGRLDVTAVELMVDVRDRQGQTPADLTIADFEILEDGVPAELIGLDYAETWRTPEVIRATALDGVAVAGNTSDDIVRQPWRSLIYVDGSLISTRSLQRSLKALAKRVPDLVELGPVEVVLANPLPEVVLPFTHDAARIEETLRTLSKDVQALDELARLRREFLQTRDAMYNGALITVKDVEVISDYANEVLHEDKHNTVEEMTDNAIRQFVTREDALIRRQVQVLNDWIDAYGYAPGAALLVNDGYDLDARDFYLNAVKNAQLDLVGELMRYRFEDVTVDLARDLAAKGWTAAFLAVNGIRAPDAAEAGSWSRDRMRSISEDSGQPQFGSVNGLIAYPLEPLLIAADETGGEVMTTPKMIEERVSRLGERVRLTYRAPRSADGQLHKLDVRCNRRDLEVLAPRTVSSPTAAQIAEARARRLLIAEMGAGELPVTVGLQSRGVKADGERPIEVEVTFDLNTLKPILGDGEAPIRFTVGVSMSKAPPFVYQVTENVKLFTTGPEGRYPQYVYKVVLGMPGGAEQVSVVVEDLQSGLWGGVVKDARILGDPVEGDKV